MVTDTGRTGATRRAFDAAAPTYAAEVGANAILEAMRARSIAAIERWVPRGGSLLEIGCGPGLDAARLAAAGYRVTAIDASEAMVREAKHRLASSPDAGAVRLLQIGADELDRLEAEQFDGAYSNLGVLNCVDDLAAVGRAISGRLAGPGVLVATVMGRFCPWEVALYAARRQWSRARVRFAAEAVPVPFRGQTVWTRYYTPREFSKAMGQAGFQAVDLRGLALAAPPPYVDGFLHRHPHIVNALLACDDRVGGWPVIRQLGDHFLAVMRKMPGGSP